MQNMLAFLVLFAASSAANANHRAQLSQNTGEDQVSRSAISIHGEGTKPNQSLANARPPNWYAIPEGWLCILGIPTLFFVGWQARETARSAKATEKATELAGSTAEHQLRAYVSVAIGSALYQQRRPDNSNGDLLFECRPLLINTGQTPAKNLKFKARAAILPFPLPKGHHLPEGFDEEVGESIMAPKQQANLFATVDGFCQDNEVEAIKTIAGPKGLYTWGLVTYSDIFGNAHFTRFCHHVYWIGDEVRGLYVPGRNDAE